MTGPLGTSVNIVKSVYLTGMVIVLNLHGVYMRSRRVHIYDVKLPCGKRCASETDVVSTVTLVSEHEFTIHVGRTWGDVTNVVSL